MKPTMTYACLLLLFATALRAADPPKLDKVMLQCGAIRAELIPQQAAGDLANFTFEVLNASGTPVSTSSSPIAEPNNMVSGALLALPSGTVIAKGSYVVLRQDATILGIKPIAMASGTITVDPTRRTELDVSFLSCLVDRDTMVVAVTRNGEPLDGLLAAIVPERTTDKVITLRLNTPLRHEDTVTITARTPTNDAVSAELEMDLGAPADMESATVYVGGKLELAEGSKPKVLADLKFDGRLRPISTRWFHGPSLLVDASTQDSDGEGTASAGYGFKYLDYFRMRDAAGNTRFVLTRTDITGALEADDGLNTRNLIAEVRHQWQFAGKKLNFKPAIGLEAGQNLAQKTKLEEFSDYKILRPTVDVYLSRTFKEVPMFKSISFSIDTQSRYLIEKEPDVEPLPEAEQTDDTKTKTVAADGFKFYAKAALTFGLTETFGIALEYELGERPPLFGENNKGGLAIVYSY